MYDFETDPKRIEAKLFCSMSAHFLTEELPVEAIDWEHEKVEEFVDENRWEPFEYWDTENIVEVIDNAACHAYLFMKNNWKEIADDEELSSTTQD